ncbi:MAG: hypothetical protein A4S14_16495 [Proteobacteria bacterium SG_bin9]|nr:MAG: hypothetical protein A4S14_16495 [Proteobacteria bacterium SG_bin9]
MQQPVIGAADDVLVRTQVFPINPADLLTMQGIYPRVDASTMAIGNEAIGEITEIGDGIDDLKPGDRVILLSLNNWREFRLVKRSEVIKVSPVGDLLQQAGLKVNPATARLLLANFVALKPGDWIIQSAANSAVSRAVIQIAQTFGIKTINVVRRADVMDELRTLGADIVLEDSSDLASVVNSASGGVPVRLGLDSIGGATADRLAACLAPDATLVVYGAMSGEPVTISPAALVFKNLTLRSFWLTPHLTKAAPADVRTLYQTLDGMVVGGQLKTRIDSEFEVFAIKDAVRRAAQPALNGKVMVRF